MNRRYRHVPLSESAKAAYHRVHYAYAKWEFADRLADVYEMCHSDGVPFIAIIQPRTYCTLELDLDPAGFRMNEVEQKVITLWAENAFRNSNSRKSAQSVAVSDHGAIIRGLDLEIAKSLANRIWIVLAKTETEVSA